jgi:hypothetical protein
MIDVLFAWNWVGHGQLTSMALGLAIAHFIPAASKLVLKRLKFIADWRSGINQSTFGRPDYPPSEREVAKYVQEVEKGPISPSAATLIRAFFDLPGSVQEQDIHRGNIPSIGESLEKDSQVRHFMRSRPDVTPREAFDASVAYIRNNLYWSWLCMRKVIRHKESWTDFFYDASLSDFGDGEDYLAKALHTIEDSYAPGHAARRQGTGIILNVNIWNDANRKPDPSKSWPGHEALDDPDAALSRPFFLMARIAAADLIYVVLANLDKDQSVFLKNLDNTIFANFAFVPETK